MVKNKCITLLNLNETFQFTMATIYIIFMLAEKVIETKIQQALA